MKYRNDSSNLFLAKQTQCSIIGPKAKTCTNNNTIFVDAITNTEEELVPFSHVVREPGSRSESEVWQDNEIDN